jgi:hypothetical protein
MHLWRGRWSAVTWRAYLDAGVAESQLTAIRRSTYRGRPLGSLTGVHPHAGKTNQTPAGASKTRAQEEDRLEREPGDIFVWCLVDHLCLVEPIRPAFAGARLFRWVDVPKLRNSH